MVRYLGLGKETTFGTGVTPTEWIDITSESLQLQMGYLYPETIQARQKLRTISGPKVVTGGWEQYVNYRNLGMALKALLGKETLSAGTGVDVGADTHTFNPEAPETALPSLTVEKGLDAVTAQRFLGVAIDQIQLSVGGGDPLLRGSVSVVGRDAATQALATPSFVDQDFLSWADLNTFTIGGTAATPERIGVTVKNNLPQDHHQIGSRLLPRVEKGFIEVTGEMDIRFTATAHLDDFLAGTKRALIAQWESSGVIIAGGTKKYTLKLDIPAMNYNLSNAFIDRNERLVQNIQFEGLKTTTKDVIEVVLINNKTGVY